MKAWIRAKRLVNDGEFSKAAREINEAGVAPPNKQVVEWLRSKYPRRTEEVRWPEEDEIADEVEQAKMLDNKKRVSGKKMNEIVEKEKSEDRQMEVDTPMETETKAQTVKAEKSENKPTRLTDKRESKGSECKYIRYITGHFGGCQTCEEICWRRASAGHSLDGEASHRG